MSDKISGDGWELYRGDCLEVLPTLEAGSVDCILTDPPYGTTQCKWDTVIPFKPMWAGVKHVRKPRAAVALFGSEPFSSLLRVSNLGEYKYDWVWDKVRGVGFQIAKYRPMMRHEIVSVFGNGAVNYYPVMERKKKIKTSKCYSLSDSNPLAKNDGKERSYTHSFPSSIIRVSNAKQDGLHQTQKPVALLEYLIRTYTNEGDTVLDFTMGSGSTGVAAVKLNRRFIGIELDAEYFNIAHQRIANAAGDYMPTEKEKANNQPSLLW
jgi:site-specific DNA-methyltransferase (adenine-specific)